MAYKHWHNHVTIDAARAVRMIDGDLNYLVRIQLPNPIAMLSLAHPVDCGGVLLYATRRCVPGPDRSSVLCSFTGLVSTLYGIHAQTHISHFVHMVRVCLYLCLCTIVIKVVRESELFVR